MIRLIKKWWSGIHLRYVAFYARHSLESKECGIKVLLTDQRKQDPQSLLAAQKLIIRAIDNHLFRLKGLVGKDAECWSEFDNANRATEVGIVIDYLGRDKWVRLLPMPALMYRERIVTLHDWWPRQKDRLANIFDDLTTVAGR